MSETPDGRAEIREFIKTRKDLTLPQQAAAISIADAAFVAMARQVNAIPAGVLDDATISASLAAVVHSWQMSLKEGTGEP